MALVRIISGGQTGADQAGLFAAVELGLKTGGYMPHGWRTDEGSRPEFEAQFGMFQDSSSLYPPRTEKNVKMSNGTLIFGTLSGGSGLTIHLCRKFHKPQVVVPWPAPTYWAETDFKEKFRHFLIEMNIQTLNVAGNRERKNPGIFDACKVFLMEALR